MDNNTRMQALIDTHGNYRPDLGATHPENKKLLPKVAREVANEFRSYGKRGYGYEVVHAEDIYQRMVLKMAEEGVTAEDLNHPEAQGRVRAFARHAALREVESARANVRTEQGARVVNLTSFVVPQDGINEAGFAQLEDADAVRSLEAFETNHSPLGNPEAELLRVDLLSKLQGLADDLISKAPEKFREALTLYFVEGMTIEGVAETLDMSYDWASKSVQRGRRTLHGDEVASLLGIRAYFHPSAKRPGRMKDVGTPTALLDLLS